MYIVKPGVVDEKTAALRREASTLNNTEGIHHESAVVICSSLAIGVDLFSSNEATITPMLLVNATSQGYVASELRAENAKQARAPLHDNNGKH